MVLWTSRASRSRCSSEARSRQLGKQERGLEARSRPARDPGCGFELSFIESLGLRRSAMIAPNIVSSKGSADHEDLSGAPRRRHRVGHGVLSRPRAVDQLDVLGAPRPRAAPWLATGTRESGRSPMRTVARSSGTATASSSRTDAACACACRPPRHWCERSSRRMIDWASSPVLGRAQFEIGGRRQPAAPHPETSEDERTAEPPPHLPQRGARRARREETQPETRRQRRTCREPQPDPSADKTRVVCRGEGEWAASLPASSRAAPANTEATTTRPN